MARLLALLCLLFSFHAHSEDTMPLTHQALTQQKTWLNMERALTPDDLRGRIVLLDFWTFCCINCMHVIPDLKYLEEKFGDRLTVIGVHSAKFENERDTENIRSAILRYDIEHPVVNDFDFTIWKSFGVRAWPTFVLLAPDGRIANIYSGEGNRDEAERDIAALIARHGDTLNTAPLPVALEKNKQPQTVLKFPGKITQGIRILPSSNGGMLPHELLYISDSGHNRILAVNLAGEEIFTAGGAEGFRDGSFEAAQFRSPLGILEKDGMLYVADTGNHAIRRINPATRMVETIAGTGKQGHERRAKNASAKTTPLASPWDLAFFPDKNHIAIAMAGTHQLWSYDIEKETVSVIAGNGSESIDDGEYPYNSLSQPSGLAAYEGRLYFVDSETSSLRVYDGKGITTLIGTGLFDFGFKDGTQGEALMQHPLGIYADESGVYIADSYNHSIRKYDPHTKQLSTLAGNGKRGAFNELGDIERLGMQFYIADTNAHAIRIWDAPTGALSEFVVQRSKAGPTLSDNLPSLQVMPQTIVKANAVLKITLALKPGWKINHEAPSYLALFENGKAIADYGRAMLEKKTISLPALKDGAYRLQGTLYYCENREGAQCLIKSFDQSLKAVTDGATSLTWSFE